MQTVYDPSLRLIARVDGESWIGLETRVVVMCVTLVGRVKVIFAIFFETREIVIVDMIV